MVDEPVEGRVGGPLEGMASKWVVGVVRGFRAARRRCEENEELATSEVDAKALTDVLDETGLLGDGESRDGLLGKLTPVKVNFLRYWKAMEECLFEGMWGRAVSEAELKEDLEENGKAVLSCMRDFRDGVLELAAADEAQSLGVKEICSVVRIIRDRSEDAEFWNEMLEQLKGAATIAGEGGSSSSLSLIRLSDAIHDWLDEYLQDDEDITGDDDDVDESPVVGDDTPVEGKHNRNSAAGDQSDFFSATTTTGPMSTNRFQQSSFSDNKTDTQRSRDVASGLRGGGFHEDDIQRGNTKSSLLLKQIGQSSTAKLQQQQKRQSASPSSPILVNDDDDDGDYSRPPSSEETYESAPERGDLINAVSAGMMRVHESLLNTPNMRHSEAYKNLTAVLDRLPSLEQFVIENEQSAAGLAQKLAQWKRDFEKTEKRIQKLEIENQKLRKESETTSLRCVSLEQIKGSEIDRLNESVDAERAKKNQAVAIQKALEKKVEDLESQKTRLQQEADELRDKLTTEQEAAVKRAASKPGRQASRKRVPTLPPLRPPVESIQESHQQGKRRTSQMGLTLLAPNAQDDFDHYAAEILTLKRECEEYESKVRNLKTRLMEAESQNESLNRQLTWCQSNIAHLRQTRDAIALAVDCLSVTESETGQEVIDATAEEAMAAKKGTLEALVRHVRQLEAWVDKFRVESASVIPSPPEAATEMPSSLQAELGAIKATLGPPGVTFEKKVSQDVSSRKEKQIDQLKADVVTLRARLANINSKHSQFISTVVPQEEVVTGRDGPLVSPTSHLAPPLSPLKSSATSHKVGFPEDNLKKSFLSSEGVGGSHSPHTSGTGSSGRSSIAGKAAHRALHMRSPTSQRKLAKSFSRRVGLYLRSPTSPGAGPDEKEPEGEQHEAAGRTKHSSADGLKLADGEEDGVAKRRPRRAATRFDPKKKLKSRSPPRLLPDLHTRTAMPLPAEGSSVGGASVNLTSSIVMLAQASDGMMIGTRRQHSQGGKEMTQVPTGEHGKQELADSPGTCGCDAVVCLQRRPVRRQLARGWLWRPMAATTGQLPPLIDLPRHATLIQGACFVSPRRDFLRETA